MGRVLATGCKADCCRPSCSGCGGELWDFDQGECEWYERDVPIAWSNYGACSEPCYEKVRSLFEHTIRRLAEERAQR